MENERQARSLRIDANVMLLDAAVVDMIADLSHKANFYGFEFPILNTPMYKAKESGNLQTLMPQAVKFLSQNFDQLSYSEKLLVCMGWEGLWGQGETPDQVINFEYSALTIYARRRYNCPNYSDPWVESLLILK
jgi:hypothetical protein